MATAQQLMALRLVFAWRDILVLSVLTLTNVQATTVVVEAHFASTFKDLMAVVALDPVLPVLVLIVPVKLFHLEVLSQELQK